MSFYCIEFAIRLELFCCGESSIEQGKIFPVVFIWGTFFPIFLSFVETFKEPSVVFKVAADGSADDASTPPAKSEVSSAEAKDVKNSVLSPPTILASEESISQFFTQVASLVK